MKKEHAPDLLKFFLFRTGILEEPVEDKIQFAHLSFQEYLTALFLYNVGTAVDKKEITQELYQKLDNESWREVAHLYLSIDSERTFGKGHNRLLGYLNVKEDSHLIFLAEVLGTKEIPLSEDERKTWLTIIVFWKGLKPYVEIGELIKQEESNEDLMNLLITDFLELWPEINLNKEIEQCSNIITPKKRSLPGSQPRAYDQLQLIEKLNQSTFNAGNFLEGLLLLIEEISSSNLYNITPLDKYIIDRFYQLPLTLYSVMNISLFYLIKGLTDFLTINGLIVSSQINMKVLAIARPLANELDMANQLALTLRRRLVGYIARKLYQTKKEQAQAHARAHGGLHAADIVSRDMARYHDRIMVNIQHQANLDSQLVQVLAPARVLAMNLAIDRDMPWDWSLDLASYLAPYIEKHIVHLRELLRKENSKEKRKTLRRLTLTVLLHIFWYHMFFENLPHMKTSITTSDLTALIPWLSDLEAFIKGPLDELRPFLLKADEVWPMSPENEEYLRKYYSEAMKHPLSPLSSAQRLFEDMKEKGIEKVDIEPEAFAQWLEGELDKIEGKV
jgi:hypothetical protein